MLKRTEDCPSRASSRSKTFPEYPQCSVYHAAIQNRGRAWFWDSEKWSVDSERGSLQSCSLFQDRKFLSNLTKNLLCSVSPETHSRRIPLLIQRQFINFRLSCSICFFVTNSSQFFNFFAVFYLIFSEESIPHCQLPIQAYSVSLSLISHLIRPLQL